VKPTFALALTALLCAGCRSDGGIDRKDCQSGIEFSTHCVAEQTKTDFANMTRMIGGAPYALARAVKDGAATMSSTYHLYVDNHEMR
jgi:uncharacterized protein YcfL